MIAMILLIAVVGQSCPAHSFLNTSNGICQICDPSCYLCENTSLSCISCSPTYYKNVSDSTCIACRVGCASCTSDVNCTSCMDTYFLQVNICLKCGFNCMICTSNVTCNYCCAGYEISTNCATCSNEYYWRNATSSCEYCGIGCKICNATICTLCSQKYILEEDGTCLYNPLSSLRKNQSETSQLMSKNVFIGLISGVAGSIIVIILVCKLFRCYKKHLNLVNAERKTSLDQIVVASHLQIDLSKEESMQESSFIACQTCGKDGADFKAPCSHSYHQICYETHSNRKCFACRQEISSGTVQIDKQGNLQAQSDLNQDRDSRSHFLFGENESNLSSQQ